jgi:ribonuclease P protein component
VKGERLLSKNSQFVLVYEKGRSWVGKELVLKTMPNGLAGSRFGFVVSRRIGKAVVRNRVKRRLKEITRQMAVKPGWDAVLIARIPLVDEDYRDLEKAVAKLLRRAGLLMGENEGNSLIVN